MRIWWSDDAAWYGGEVKSFDGEKHAILYDDGEDEALDLSREKHEFVAARPPLATLGRTHRGAPARCYAKGTPQSRGAGVTPYDWSTTTRSTLLLRRRPH